MVVPYFTRHAKNALSCCTSMTLICANNHKMNGFLWYFFAECVPVLCAHHCAEYKSDSNGCQICECECEPCRCHEVLLSPAPMIRDERGCPMCDCSPQGPSPAVSRNRAASCQVFLGRQSRGITHAKNLVAAFRTEPQQTPGRVMFNT